ncbi:diacylglycerol kinase family protein [Salinibacillus xinjiangensis]|uniref:Diacylglycerol kinase n=1 Tax=Salinibacillus xinjiangensis TaxID=1229268 RepID=A0A6G1X6Q7_9BACI|nr:diacylglycerol kinase family protein [Salinibacillus xinjiangensis]MRG86627.1 diacylglycerol kinase [Salinibacillus xinjiangensis]
MSSDSNENNVKKGIGFGFAFNGILLAFRAEKNFRIHILIAFVVITLGLLVGLSIVEWLLVSLCIGFVLVTEMINSAIEALIDHLFPDYHEVAGRVKDLSAGAVLVAAICTAVIGVIIFLPKIYHIIV